MVQDYNLLLASSKKHRQFICESLVLTNITWTRADETIVLSDQVIKSLNRICCYILNRNRSYFLTSPEQLNSMPPSRENFNSISFEVLTSVNVPILTRTNTSVGMTQLSTRTLGTLIGWFTSSALQLINPFFLYESQCSDLEMMKAHIVLIFVAVVAVIALVGVHLIPFHKRIMLSTGGLM